ncbi:GNAT family N-acetyltransferase [Mechercharimyces sp. CAU 1602]|uniref:GNAT family N-acetyltransferase n=1 Tax=Mechercharimyces sp. CAU 1602 TaxID=2973933 RepID=UPI0021639D04|nr:GNAT family N-acetyltransferase [Mechercharimyces sp. CAU 1602]MCS1351036.1 GNAT family N-acetyltransferase [Mechercharimyces sp. CAU 1602]
MNPTIRIEEVNKDNWYECCQLSVSTAQAEYMESNAISIAQSKFEESLKPYAIYYEEAVVGFLMFNSVLEELDGYWIYRIMIDENYQGKGIGKQATQLMLDEIRNLRQANKVVVGYHPENTEAHRLYASLGFVDQGDRFGKEMAVVLHI